RRPSGRRRCRRWAWRRSLPHPCVIRPEGENGVMRGAIGGRARRYDARMNILGIRSAAAARTAALAAVLALAGCGGGIWVGIGDDFDDPPAVSLTASSTQAPAGAGIRLIAAAADDDGIDVVEFYRYDGSGVRRLGS